MTRPSDRFWDALPKRPLTEPSLAIRLLVAAVIVDLALLGAAVLYFTLWWLFFSGPAWKPRVYVDREQNVVCTEQSGPGDDLWKCAEMQS